MSGSLMFFKKKLSGLSAGQSRRPDNPPSADSITTAASWPSGKRSLISKGLPDHSPTARIDRTTFELLPAFGLHFRRGRFSSFECAAASSVLRHPVGTPAHGAVGLQSLVPLVRWTFARRPDLEPDDLHEEPRSAADRRGICQVHQQTSEPSGGQAAVVGRAFFGGRNADRGVGLAQEFRPKDGSGDDDEQGRLPRPAAQKRHACEH